MSVEMLQVVVNFLLGVSVGFIIMKYIWERDH